MIVSGFRTFRGGKGQFRACASIGVKAEKLAKKLDEDLHRRIGRKILNSIGSAPRRPPVKTGRLEQSGSVFVGNELIGTTNRGVGTPVVTMAGGLPHRIYLVYSAIDRGFNYAYYQNYNTRIGKPWEHLWVEAIMARERVRRFARQAIDEIVNECS